MAINIFKKDNPVDFTASAYMEEEVEKVSPSHGANRRMSHHHAHMSTNGDTITKNGGVKFNVASLSSAAHEPSEGHGGGHGGGHSSVHGGHNSIHGGGHGSNHGGHGHVYELSILLQKYILLFEFFIRTSIR